MGYNFWEGVINQILINIKQNFAINNLLSDYPFRIFLFSSCFIIYRLVFDKPINDTNRIIFFLTVGATIYGMSKDKDVKSLEF